MPIFHENDGKLSTVQRIDFPTERILQTLIEQNLNEVFGARLVATEFSTGSVHSGRIDTLALSEDGNPMIIEYKKVESASLITQALYYLDWIKDHRGDFEKVTRKALGEVEVDWSNVRVICIAPSFDRYSLHAVKHIGSGIELWQFHRYENHVIELEEVYKEISMPRSKNNAPDSVNLGDEVVTSKPVYTFDEHQAKADDELKPILNSVTEYISSLNISIKEVPQKYYVAYKLAKNVACIEVQKRRILVYIYLDYEETMDEIASDIRGKGHWGTGTLLISIKNELDLVPAFELIRRAYLKASGD